jgi:heme A synthase
MTIVFTAAIAFCLGLIAFCASVWLTTWASASSNQYSETNAAKMAGYFVTVLSILSLVLTSYYGAKSVMIGNSYNGGTPMRSQWNQAGNMQKHIKRNVNPSATTGKPTTTQGSSNTQ